MSAFEYVKRELGDMSDFRATAFAIACGERVLPVARYLASAPTVELCEVAMDALWQHCAGVPFDTVTWESRAMALPEAELDDSNDPRFYGGFALGIIVDAILATNEPTAAEWARSASEGCLNLAGDLDFSVMEITQRDFGLRDQEGDVQRRLVDTLRSVTPEQIGALAKELREQARVHASAFDTGVRAAGLTSP